MKPINDLLLAAYLDGEADSLERSRVDSALAADPALAARFRRIASTRDLIASMSRPACPLDLSQAILAKLAASPATDRLDRSSTDRRSAIVSRKRSRIIRLISTRDRFAGFAAAIAAAAAVLLIIAVAYRPNRPTDSNRLARVDSASKSASARDAKSLLLRNPRSRLSAAQRVLQDTARSLELEDQERFAAALAAPTEAEIEHELSRESLVNILDRPASKRFVVAADKLDDSLLERVEEIIRDTPRKDPRYGRITIAPGAGFDPDHPAEGVVFALAVDEPELKRLEASLKSKFNNQLIESRLDDALVARLAETDEVAIETGEPVPLVHHNPIAVASNKAEPTSESRRPVLAESADATDHEASPVPDEPENAKRLAPPGVESRVRSTPTRRGLSKQKQLKERRLTVADSARDALKGAPLDRGADLGRKADEIDSAKPSASNTNDSKALITQTPEEISVVSGLNSVRIEKPAGFGDQRTQAAKPSTTIVIVEIVAASPKSTR